MTSLLVIFFTSLALLFYSYLGYGLLLLILPVRNKKKGTVTSPFVPVTIIIAAYNEERILAQKIENTLSLTYPEELLTVIVVTDGSDDQSQSIVKSYPAVQLMHDTVRRGKYAALQHAMQEVKTPVVIFTDANSMLNKEAVNRMMLHYNDPAVGGVTGEKKIITGAAGNAVGQAEGLYWRYESFMKKLDARFYTVVGAAGELFSIRTALFPQSEEQIILDDFIISIRVCMQGYRIAYEPGAFAAETASESLKEEQKRKIRIAAGAYQAAGLLKEALYLFRFPRLSFQYFSRRILRWFFCPFLLIVLLISNTLIVLKDDPSFFYQLILAAQGFYYLLSLLGWLLLRAGKKAGLLGVPYYFLFMNFCLVRGFLLFLKGKQSVLWEKAVRQSA